jgi:DNA replication and repair protein RecF
MSWKCNKNDIKFWNEKFVEEATNIYRYRFKIVNFLKISIENTKEFFSWKIENIEFIYNTKVSEENTSQNLRDYLDKNIDRDIVLWRTPIWPHVDDFDILVDWLQLSHFASRWETKSVILWLKLLEWIFIEKMTWKKPILLIDDLLSELDTNHKDMLLKKIEYYQTFISSITKTENKNIIMI